MKASVLPPVENRARQERKAQLKAMSDERQKHWPNTLEALRRKKESFIKDREEKEELKRQEIDREEAELRKTLRLESIKRANELLYEQTDKMKMLKGQVLYADVLHTRKQQIVEKEKAKDAVKEVDRQFHGITMEKVRVGEIAEKEKAEEIKAMHEKVEISRRQQLEERRAQRAAAEAETNRIGEAMKQRAIEQLAAEEQKAKERKQMLWERNQETLRANAELQNLRHTLIEKEREAEASRDAEIELIEDRKKIRKAIELRRFEKQQQKRQQLIDAATERMNAFQSKENEILFKQIADKEADDERKFQEKEARRRQEWEETVKSRTAQIEAKKVSKDIKKVEETADIARIKAAAAEANRIEEQKEAERRAKVKALKNNQYREASEAQRKKVDERLQIIEKERLQGSLLQQDNDKFTEICKAKVLEYAEAGKPVYPLLRALEHTQPDLLAAKTVKVSREKKASE